MGSTTWTLEDAESEHRWRRYEARKDIELIADVWRDSMGWWWWMVSLNGHQLGNTQRTPRTHSALGDMMKAQRLASDEMRRVALALGNSVR